MKLFVRHSILFLLILFSAFSLFGGEVASDHFVVRDDRGLSLDVVESILHSAERARQEITDRVKAPLDYEIELVLCVTADDFARRTNFNSEHILAAAIASRNQILINLSPMSQYSATTFYETLLHEYTHIYIGNMCRGSLPRWLEEGIAMHLAGDWNFNDSISLAMARLAGRYIPLSQLEGPFPREENAMRLAYLQSRSMVAYILKKRYGGADVSVFLNDLTDPEEGAELIALYWNRLVRDGLETSWRQSTRRVARNILLIITSNTFILFAMTLLAVVAFIRKRQRQKPLLEEWTREEEVYSSLRDEDSWYYSGDDDEE